jgi:hypothetical protein
MMMMMRLILGRYPAVKLMPFVHNRFAAKRVFSSSSVSSSASSTSSSSSSSSSTTSSASSSTEKSHPPPVERLRESYANILQAIPNEDSSRHGLQKTPLRAAQAMLHFTQGYNLSLSSIINDAVFNDAAHDSNEMVIVKDIDIFSLCEHHLGFMSFFSFFASFYLFLFMNV